MTLPPLPYKILTTRYSTRYNDYFVKCNNSKINNFDLSKNFTIFLYEKYNI